MSLETLRPKHLNEVVGQIEPIKVLKGYIAHASAGGMMPSFLLSGPPGVGKTTCAMAFARDVLGEGWQENWLEINGSEARGIDEVRDHVRPWMDQSPANGAPFRLLFIDEAEMMTDPAQQALKRIMERGTGARVILSCNRLSGIIEAIQSRCVCLRFRPLGDDDLRTLLGHVAKAENVQAGPERYATAIQYAHGDARRAIHLFLGTPEENLTLKLAGAIETLFRQGSERGARIEVFLGYLRSEGIDQWDEVLEAIGDHVRAKHVGDVDAALYELATCAFRLSMAQSPLLQLRGTLYGGGVLP